MKKTTIYLLSIALTACSSTGPVPMGKDTYIISRQSAGGLFVPASKIKIELIGEGSRYCATQGKTIQIVHTSELSTIPGYRLPSAEVQFMCLNENDAELKRPRLRKDSDQVIEVRKKEE